LLPLPLPIHSCASTASSINKSQHSRNKNIRKKSIANQNAIKLNFSLLCKVSGGKQASQLVSIKPRHAIQ